VSLVISSKLASSLEAVPKLTNRYIDEVEKMADWLVKQLTTLGATAEKRDIGTHELAGKECKLPSVVIGQLGNDPKKVRPNPSLRHS
jgi:hypothetical protein